MATPVSPTQRLAEFVVSTRPQDIPPQAIEKARHAIMDTMGCALAGTDEPAAQISCQWVRNAAARAEATVWGRALRTSAAEAAFANGTAGHALDFDDGLPSLRGHASTVMIPAALAVAESVGSSGTEVLAACVLGLDVAGKLGRAMGPGHYVQGWHTTSTVGVFAATAVAARLRKLDAHALQSAWGLTASQVSGLVQNFGTMTKPLHAGQAARTGVQSAWMAQHGFSANTAIFDGKKNFFTTYGRSDGEPLDELVNRLGAPWEMLEPGNYVKRWPCCYCNHRPIGGLLELIDRHQIQASEVQAVDIGFVAGSDNALRGPEPQSGLEGKFSIEYVTAAVLLNRVLTLETFTDNMVQRPEARALMKRVRRYRIDDGNYYSTKTGYTDVAITTPRGRFETRVNFVSGSPQWPMTEADMVEKFTGCAQPILGIAGTQRLLDLLARFDSLPNVGELAAATVPAKS